MIHAKGLQRKATISFSFFFLISCVIVAFGTPAWNSYLCPLASTLGFGLFWYSIKNIRSKVKRFWISLIWFTLVQAVHLSWFTAVKYQGNYILVVYFCLIIWLGAQFGCLSLFTREKSFTFSKALLVSSLWTLIEMLRLFVFCGFAFNPSGLALCYSTMSSQLLSVFGIYGMSFIVMLSSSLFYLFAIHRNRKRFFCWVVVCFLPYGFGMAHLNYHKIAKSKQKTEPVHVALVQTGLRPDEKIPLNGRTDQFVPLYDQWWRIFSYLKSQENDRFDYIVLPEAAVPFGMKSPMYPLGQTRTLLKKLLGSEFEKYLPENKSPYAFFNEDGWFVTNAFFVQVLSNVYLSEVVIGLDDADLFQNKSYNAAFHFSPYKDETYRYEKRVLVPLAEYLPIAILKPLVARYGIVDHASHGLESKVFGQKRKISISICYEECFGHLMTQGKRKGADLYVNVTNDAWYLPSKLPLQHFMHGKLRSIENGVDVLRSCNTGVTAVVNSLGENVAVFEDFSSSSQYKKGVLTASFVPYSFNTLYTAFGDLSIIGICLLSLGYYVLTLAVFRHSKIKLSC